MNRVELRPCLPSEFAARDRLIADSLFPDPTETFLSPLSNYPLALDPQYPHQSLGLFLGEKIIGHYNFLERFTVENKAPVILVGNICMDSEHRGQGFSPLLMRSIRSLAHSQKPIFLWSDLDHFFEKFWI